MLSSARSLKICLAASGGGHVRQLLDLSQAWARYDHFFITEDTALGRSIAADHRTHLVATLADPAVTQSARRAPQSLPAGET